MDTRHETAFERDALRVQLCQSSSQVIGDLQRALFCPVLIKARRLTPASMLMMMMTLKRLLDGLDGYQCCNMRSGRVC